MKYMLAGEVVGTMHPIDAGDHQFAFAFHVPRGLPSSYANDGIGSIEYFVKARAFVGSFKTDPKSCVVVPLVGDFDRRDVQLFKEPRIATNDKHFALALGKCKATLKVERPILIPGAPFAFSAEIQNGTSKDVEMVRLNCLKLTTWIGKDVTGLIKHSTTTRIKSRIDLPNSQIAAGASLERSGTFTWPEQFNAPNYNAPLICSIGYGLELVCKVHMAKNLKALVELLVINKPIIDELHRSGPLISIQAVRSNPTMQVALDHNVSLLADRLIADEHLQLHQQQQQHILAQHDHHQQQQHARTSQSSFAATNNAPTHQHHQSAPSLELTSTSVAAVVQPQLTTTPFHAPASAVASHQSAVNLQHHAPPHHHHQQQQQQQDSHAASSTLLQQQHQMFHRYFARRQHPSSNDAPPCPSRPQQKSQSHAQLQSVPKLDLPPRSASSVALLASSSSPPRAQTMSPPPPMPPMTTSMTTTTTTTTTTNDGVGAAAPGVQVSPSLAALLAASPRAHYDGATSNNANSSNNGSADSLSAALSSHQSTASSSSSSSSLSLYAAPMSPRQSTSLSQSPSPHATLSSPRIDVQHYLPMPPNPALSRSPARVVVADSSSLPSLHHQHQPAPSSTSTLEAATSSPSVLAHVIVDAPSPAATMPRKQIYGPSRDPTDDRLLRRDGIHDSSK